MNHQEQIEGLLLSVYTDYNFNTLNFGAFHGFPMRLLPAVPDVQAIVSSFNGITS